MTETNVQPPPSAPSALDTAAVSIDAIVAEAVGISPPKPAAPPAEPAAETEPEVEGEEAPEAEVAEEALAEPQAKSKDEASKSPAPAAKPGSEELRKARETAKIAGLSEATIKSMSEADLLAFSKAKAKNDRDVQRAFQENAELKRQLEEAKKAQPAQEPPKGLAEVEDALDPKLVEELGEPGARALASLVAKKVQALEARVQAAEAKAQEQQARSIFDAMRTEGEFGLDVPGDAYEQVLEKAIALSGANGLYAGLTGEERVRAVFRDAAKLLPLAATSTPSSPPPEEEKAPAKTATVTRLPQRTVRQKVNGAPDAKVDRIIGAVLRGETDPDSIARKYGGA